MTLRRLLKKKAHTPIPGKYHAQLDLYQSTTIATSIDSPAFMKDLEQKGETYTDLSQLKKDLDRKLLDTHIGPSLRSQIQHIFKIIFSKSSPKRYKALCIGALLYVINPVDLIPDTLGPIGYLDDLAVVAMVTQYIAKKERQSPAVPSR